MEKKTKETARGKETVMVHNGCRDIVVIDEDYGKCRKITIEEGMECTWTPRNPFRMETLLLVEYENGKVEEVNTLLKEVLTLGQVHCYTEDGQPGFLCNRQVVAAIGRAIAELNPFLKGEIDVPTEEEAAVILEELQIPYPPLALIEAEKKMPIIEEQWSKKWRKSGKLCFMKDFGDYEIETAIPKARREYIGQYGEGVALEAELA